MDCESCESTKIAVLIPLRVMWQVHWTTLTGTFFFSFVLGVLLTPVWLFPPFKNSFIPLLHYPNVFQIILQAILISF